MADEHEAILAAFQAICAALSDLTEEQRRRVIDAVRIVHRLDKEAP
jgi:hypothetical protein